VKNHKKSPVMGDWTINRKL